MADATLSVPATEARTHRLPQPCGDCGHRMHHTTDCRMAGTDGLRVACPQCAAVDVEMPHVCPTPAPSVARARVVFGFYSGATGTRVYLEDGTRLVEDDSEPSGFRELKPVPRSHRAAVQGR